MNQRLPLILVFLTIFTAAQSQLSAVGYKSKEYDKFKASKTYVVQTGDKDFDFAMRMAMKDQWKSKEFDFVENEEFKEKIKDNTASFILPVTIFTGTSGQQYHYLALINGGKKNLDKYNYEDMIAYAVINHFGDEESNVACYYRLPNMLASMLAAMKKVETEELRGNPKSLVDKLMADYRTQAYKIPQRVLLVNKDAIGKKMTEADFAKVYPYKFEFCDADKITKAIEQKSNKYYYYQPAITLNKSMFVFDPATGEVVYGDYQMMGLNINKNNIESLVKAIDKN